jgi:NosR/NirI family transcriptional regulator, nitrous oxide reductase regulator
MTYFAISFFMSGFFCGSYFPISGYYLKELNTSDTGSASNLEFADNIGGAFGSIVFSIILLPIAGLQNSLLLFIILLVASTIHMLILKNRKRKGIVKKIDFNNFDYLIKSAGFVLLGITAVCILIFNVLNSEQMQKEDNIAFTLSKKEVLDLTGDNNTVQLNTVKVEDAVISYYSIYDKKEKLIGYIFRTKDFSKLITGYAGPINMMTYLCPEGKVQNFVVVDSNETPSYLNEVMKKKNTFIGQRAYNNEKYQLNAITGATVTSTAISEILHHSGNNFYSSLNSKKNTTKLVTQKKGISTPLVILLFAFFIIAIARLRKTQFPAKRHSRICFLIFILITFGFIYNLQFSTDQIFALVSGQIYLSSPDTYLFLCIGVPIIVIIFGNVYCGYLCPFGALQELISDIASLICFLFNIKLPVSNIKVSSIIWKVTRSFKYVILFIFIIFFVIIQDKSLFSDSDILINAFSFTSKGIALMLLVLFIFISLFYKRMWCRVFCPSGAFLSILNGIHRIFRKRKVIVRNCDIGVTDRSDFDCICCDRCYTKKKINRRQISKRNSLLFLLLSILLFLVLIMQVYLFDDSNNKIQEKAVMISKQVKDNTETKKNIKYSNPQQPIIPISKSRKINIEKYKTYISKSKLSDQEASYYNKLDS